MLEGREGNNAILECINLWLGTEDRENVREKKSKKAGTGKDFRLDNWEKGGLGKGGGE